MNFTFIKEYIGDYDIPGYDTIEFAMIYRVFDGERKVGEVFHCQAFTQLRYDGLDILIKTNQPWYRKQWFKIINYDTEAELGEVRLNAIAGSWDKLFIGDKTYRWKRMKPEVKYKVFNRATWNYYKVGVFSSEEACNYHFNVEPGRRSWAINMRNLTGKIEYAGTNLLLIFAGFYFVERWLEKQSKSD